MRQKSGTGKAPAEQVIKDIRRATSHAGLPPHPPRQDSVSATVSV